MGDVVAQGGRGEHRQGDQGRRVVEQLVRVDAEPPLRRGGGALREHRRDDRDGAVERAERRHGVVVDLGDVEPAHEGHERRQRRAVREPVARQVLRRQRAGDAGQLGHLEEAHRVLLEVQVHEGHGQKAGAGDADHRPPFAGLVREDAAPQHDPHARGGEGHLAAREKDNVVEPVLRHEPFVDQHHGAARQQVREDREHERHAQRRAEDARALAVFVEPGARTHRLRRAQDDKCFYSTPLLSAAGVLPSEDSR